MKNYLKFVVAVFGVVISLCASGVVNAQKDKGEPGTCTLNSQICGRTGDGNIISGTYNE
ncbi:hypothetical protein [Flavobacterium sp. HBTb2-11-1]|uniref:hypothetical protein n=1 Tax=Flavobacterium sp. HBTb2-11-1 TaxID=2692212 RepID=UPI00136D356B|nr:hypothetical protein [Flavobacterium sp. HBTb2-11-1]MXO06456.1 hypothetical protein [Flavobacterium sp. HBTb2-11-1]